MASPSAAETTLYSQWQNCRCCYFPHAQEVRRRALIPVVESMSFGHGGATIPSGNCCSKDVDDELREIFYFIKTKDQHA
jgi:hypothetical protein